MFRQITILAPGLLGASLGQAVFERKLAERVVCWARRPETRVACADAAWCSAAPDTLKEAVKNADLVILCPPVGAIIPLLQQIAEDLPDGCLVTDVGSTKSLICRQAEAALPTGRVFIGAHPMAGSERTGLENARADLFEGRPVFLTPLPTTPSEPVTRLVRFWHALGMTVTTVSPERHDEIVAHISHLPHLAATMLCLTLREQDPTWAAYAGGGLRDTTRIAAGSPTLWRDICEHNREEIIRSLRGMEDSLHAVRAALENENFTQLQHLLELGKQYRLHIGETPTA